MVWVVLRAQGLRNLVFLLVPVAAVLANGVGTIYGLGIQARAGNHCIFTPQLLLFLCTLAWFSRPAAQDAPAIEHAQHLMYSLPRTVPE